MIALFAAAVALASACPTGPQGAQCRAVEATAAGRSAVAAAEFEALAASSAGPTRARALAAAGNMWLAASEHGKAALALDKALTGTGLQAEQRGEALLDRARVAEAQGDLKLARAKAAEAERTIGEDPFLWYFLAGLAIREENRAEAQRAIGRALALEPNEPLVLFQAGHVHHFLGDEAKAREYWTRAATADPSGPIGRQSKEALALMSRPVLPKSRQ
jgi:tetratricopeptide (TPR) repeat protein